MDNELLALDAQEKDVEPLAADEFFAVGDGLARRDSGESEEIGLRVFKHEEP